ncbi:photosynthetic complex putative assembly protein PuhB [Methylobacterium sp. WL8]|uniref:photosynthetic complex putative assembly protein PuhB n=1 Tax=Methylobacterium sp. WL8 TaxID=2603899 RepID=UPI0011CACD78|nr:photosynthetic complex putative assembly protein PuhB [Methylobacterium sp. WL8]TXN84232.1 PH domain-containing protein [Methylobacterium sp. WL8]
MSDRRIHDTSQDDTVVDDRIPEGLPEALPPGEHILWQGRPTAFGMAARPMHGGFVVLWFAVLAAWTILPAALDGEVLAGLKASWPTFAACAAALVVVGGLGWLASWTTTYTITNRRVVMRIGIAIPVTFNLPLAQVEDAALHSFADGTGDLPLRLSAGTRVAYLHLWPHARPWRVTEPQPMLRSVPDAAAVAAILGRAIVAARAPEEESALPILVARPQAASRQPRLVAVGAR